MRVSEEVVARIYCRNHSHLHRNLIGSSWIVLHLLPAPEAAEGTDGASDHTTSQARACSGSNFYTDVIIS